MTKGAIWKIFFDAFSATEDPVNDGNLAGAMACYEAGRTASRTLPEFIDLNHPFEVCVFSNGQFSLRVKDGEDRAHVRYLTKHEIELLRAGFSVTLPPMNPADTTIHTKGE